MRICLLILFTIMFSNTTFAAGIYVGNGGDGIYCKATTANGLKGYYALDYILTLSALSGDDGLAQVTSWQNSANRIFKILTDKVPSLAASFKEFSRLVYNTSYAEMRVWEPAPFGLNQLNDQRITSLIPDNCKADDGTYQVVQAVIRQYEGFSGTQTGHYIYKYFPKLLSDLDKQAPIQLSFLLIHEWLWDVSSNVDRNRRINRFLHSRAIEGMQPSEVVANLKGMGLYLPDKPADAFDPDSCQGYPLTEADLFSKYSGQAVLANMGQLKIDRRERMSECAQNEIGCNPNWKNPAFKSRLLEEYRFFLSPAWEWDTKNYPIKIISPDLITKSGRPVKAVAAQIYCRFIDGKELNLECKLMDVDMGYPLGLSLRNTPLNQWPIFSGKLTQECFRVSIPGHYTMELFDPNSPVREKDVITETVFSSRFRWVPSAAAL